MMRVPVKGGGGKGQRVEGGLVIHPSIHLYPVSHIPYLMPVSVSVFVPVSIG